MLQNMRSFTIVAAALSVSSGCSNVLAAASSSAPSTGTASASIEQPRRGSHISTGFPKPALLASSSVTSTSTGADDDILKPSSARRGNRKDHGGSSSEHEGNKSTLASRGGGGRGRLNQNYGFMSGVFDNEYMQRNIQDLFVE